MKNYWKKWNSARKKRQAAEYDNVDAQFSSIAEIGSVALEHAVEDARVYAQSLYAAHNASDNRGLAFGSILTSAGSALYLFPLLTQDKNLSVDLLQTSTFTGIALFLCGLACFVSVWPRKYCLPGNEPAGWLPENWFVKGNYSKNNVLIEQLKAVQYQVVKNRRAAKRKAYVQRAALFVALSAIALAGFRTAPTWL